MPVIQALPRIAGTIASTVAGLRLRDDPSLEGRAERGRMRHLVAHAHQASRVEGGHPGREARARRGAIEPPGRDDDGVLRHGAHSAPRLRDLDDAHARDLRVLGMHARQLLARSEPDQLAHAESSRASCGSIEKPSAAASAIAYHMPPKATSTVSVPIPGPPAARRAGRRSTGRSSARRSEPFRRHTSP